MPFQRRQGNIAAIASGGATTIATTFALNCMPGSLLIAACTFDNGSDISATCADGSNGNWIEMANCHQYYSSNTQSLRCWYIINGVYSTALTATVTFSSSTYRQLGIEEFIGQAPSNALDQSISAQGASGSPAAGSIVTLSEGELVWSVEMDIIGSNTVTPGGIFTKYLDRSGDAAGGICSEAGVQATQGSQNSGWTYGTTTHNWMCALATFRPLVLPRKTYQRPAPFMPMR
jgi:hypothetical protein